MGRHRALAHAESRRDLTGGEPFGGDAQDLALALREFHVQFAAAARVPPRSSRRPAARDPPGPSRDPRPCGATGGTRTGSMFLSTKPSAPTNNARDTSRGIGVRPTPEHRMRTGSAPAASGSARTRRAPPSGRGPREPRRGNDARAGRPPVPGRRCPPRRAPPCRAGRRSASSDRRGRRAAGRRRSRRGGAGGRAVHPRCVVPLDPPSLDAVGSADRVGRPTSR